MYYSSLTGSRNKAKGCQIVILDLAAHFSVLLTTNQSSEVLYDVNPGLASPPELITSVYLCLVEITFI